MNKREKHLDTVLFFSGGLSGLTALIFPLFNSNAAQYHLILQP
jgi:hypothetical protein